MVSPSYILTYPYVFRHTYRTNSYSPSYFKYSAYTQPSRYLVRKPFSLSKTSSMTLYTLTASSHFLDCQLIHRHIPSKLHSKRFSISHQTITKMDSQNQTQEQHDSTPIPVIDATVEQQQLPNSTPPTNLADPDSMFAQIEDVLVHYKLWTSQPTSPASVLDSHQAQVPNYSSLLVCLHGFGASLFSFQLAKKALLHMSPEVGVLAYDTPGFGITSRSDRLETYSTKFSARICTTLADAVAPTTSHILVAHSMGAAPACRVVLDNPSKYSTLILVAPAIVAPPKVPSQLHSSLNFFMSGLMSIVVAFSYVLSPILLIILELVVQRRSFWKRGLSFARDPSKPVTDEVIDGYRKPVHAQGWKRGLLNFVRCTLLERTQDQDGSDDFVKRLCDLGRDAPRILIVHGASDAIVPLDNSKGLADRIPNVELAILPKCGHVPHEEDPEAFAKIVHNFLQRADQV